MQQDYESWGRYPPAPRQSPRTVQWRQDGLPLDVEGSMLPRGLGRSYGDSCLNDGGALLTTERLKHVLELDRDSGLLACEAGASLAEVLALMVPAGWFLPVTPGTKHVTLGGAVANDVHGKNHHVAGSFGNHVTRLELLRSTGERLVCSDDDNADLFRATIGGLGLTGLITWVELRLQKIENAYLVTETLPLSGLDEFFQVSEASASSTYSVAWIDSLASGADLGRGIFFRGEHAPKGEYGLSLPRPRSMLGGGSLSVPFDFPAVALNRQTTRAFNAAFFRKHRRASRTKVEHYEPFFYPLDAVDRWNRVYGRRGLVQYQCVVPPGEAPVSVAALLERVSSKGPGSFLTVLKAFGDIPARGLLSFPRPGVTLALDFPFDGESTLSLCDDLDAIVREAGGALYPAKDARMPPSMFALSFPRWQQLEALRDPAFSSSFWRRVTAR